MPKTSFNVALLCAAALLAPHAAGAASYTLAEITAPGFSNITLNSLNAAGQAVGTAVQNGQITAVIYTSGTLAALPNLPAGFEYASDPAYGWQAKGAPAQAWTPYAINDTGLVLGSLGTALTAQANFVWLYSPTTHIFGHGQFLWDWTYDQDATSAAGPLSFNNTSWALFQTGRLSRFYLAANATRLTGLSGAASHVTFSVSGALTHPAAMNNQNVIVGTYAFSFIDNRPRIFRHSPTGLTTQPFPARLTKTIGLQSFHIGAINNKANIAGDFTDAAGHVHGWYQTGKATASFLAETNHSLVTIAAMNRQNAIAGTYTNTDTTQYAFVLTAAGLLSLGTWPATTNLHIGGLTDAGQVLLSVTDSASVAHSYIGTCTGTGC